MYFWHRMEWSGLMAPADKWERAESKEGPGQALMGPSEAPGPLGGGGYQGDFCLHGLCSKQKVLGDAQHIPCLTVIVLGAEAVKLQAEGGRGAVELG